MRFTPNAEMTQLNRKAKPVRFTRNKGMSLVAALIVLAVYNVVVFTLPFHKGASFWVGYGFSMLAVALMLGVSLHAFWRESLKGKFYGMPLVYVARSYLIWQIPVGLAEMILHVIPFQYGIALNTVLLGIFLVRMIAVNIGKEKIEQIDEKVKGKVFFIRSLQGDVEGLAGRVEDDAARTALGALAEAIRFSDPMSCPQLAALERTIEDNVAALAAIVGNADAEAIHASCDELQQLLAERNRKCKMLK